MSRLSALVLGVAIATAGCNLQKPTTPAKPRPTAPAVTATARPASAALVGKVAVLSAAQAGAGEPLISNNGGSIIANNGGGVVANNGAGYRALAAKPLTEFGLVGATITVEDAAGKPVLDAAGKPITATTDAHGAYALAAALPSQAVVLRVKLWQGGELVAVVPQGPGREQAINTATTLGARYVLDRYVKGSQQTLERLPAAVAATLYAEAGKAQALLDQVPSYAPADTVTLAEDLRAKAPALDQQFTTIKTLLLGQVGLGDNQQATSVPLNRPANLMLDGAGNLLFTEDTFGRIRRIGKDGKLTTFADVIQGQVKRNFPFTKSAVRAADGTIYLAGDDAVTRIKPDGSVDTVLGQAVGATTGSTGYTPHAVALAGDTLYVGENGSKEHGPPRVFKLPAAGGTPQPVVVDATWPPGYQITGLAASAAGDLYVLGLSETADVPNQLYHVAPSGSVNLMATGLKLAGTGNSLALGPDGKVYVSECYADQVFAIPPSGKPVTLVGPGASGEAANFHTPGAILLGPDGTLYVAGALDDTISALSPDGKLTRLAGRTTSNVTDPATLPLDVPRTAQFTDDGALLVTEASQQRVLRFDGKAISTVAGGQAGAQGDGGPATAAGMEEPWGLARGPSGELYVGENGSLHVRKVDAAGVITTVVAGDGLPVTSLGLAVDQLAPALKFRARSRTMAVSPTGQLYFADANANQIYRLRADGQVEVVAGKPPASATPSLSTFLHVGPLQEQPGPALEAELGAPAALAFDAKGDLYVAETGAMLVRKLTKLDTPSPQIQRVAGLSSLDALSQDASGPGTATTTPLALPMGLALAPDGTLYVSELGTLAMPYLVTVSDEALATFSAAFAKTNARVRKIAPDGKVTIVAGPGGKFFTDPLAPDGLLFPGSLALSKDGRLAIVDAAANLVHILPAGSF